MAIAFVLDTTLTSTAGTTITTSVTVGSGSNRYLIVTGISSTSGTDQVVSVKYAGVDMTLVKKFSNVETNDRWMYVYVLANPTSGTNNLVVTNSTSQPWFGGSANEYTGVVQSTTPDAQGSDKTTTTATVTNSLTTIANNCWMFSYSKGQGWDPTAGTGTTKRDVSGTNAGFGDSNAALSVGSNSMAWGGGNGVDHWNTIFMSLAPTADTAYIPKLLLLNVG